MPRGFDLEKYAISVVEISRSSMPAAAHLVSKHPKTRKIGATLDRLSVQDVGMLEQ